MSNWWETSGASWGGDAAATDKWASSEAPAAAAPDLAVKIKQLREGQWTDGWKDFLYKDEVSGEMKSSEMDPNLGRKGWWKFLYHDGQEFQPEGLADHLEKQLGGQAAPVDAWAAAAAPAGDSWQAAAEPPVDAWAAAKASPPVDAWAPAAAAKDDSWGNWGGAAGDSGANQSWSDSRPTPNAKAFWEFQKWNVDNNVLSRKEEWELEQDDANLFPENLRSSAGIDFAAYDSVPVDVSGSKSQNIPSLGTFEEIYSMFKEMIPGECVENVRRCKYSVPTPVQKYAVPVGLAGRDVMCCAQTGSGKTAAFLIPTIGLMMKNHATPMGKLEKPFEGKCKPDTLVMSPTRELCIQIHEEAMKFCHRTGYRCCRVYGGESPKIQLEDLSKGCDLMVATPGRLQDFINREIIDLSDNYVLVLDEADRMLDMGFEKQIRDIVENHDMPKKEERQTLMFSATFPDECQKMAQDFLHEYIWIGVGIVGGAVTTVTQTLEKVSPTKKYEKLIEKLDIFYETREKDQRCLIFVNSKDLAKWLDEQLYEKHYDTGCLHGNLTQTERETNLSRYRKGDIDVMVATDVAARGLDIEKVDLVVNYDMPNEIDTYVHRIGRSGRIGNKGAAVTFISTDDEGKALDKIDVLSKLSNIMKDAGSTIPEWLEDQVQHKDDYGADNGGNSWANWGGKDMRASADGGGWWDEKKEQSY